jgi:hypothetical protein
MLGTVTARVRPLKLALLVDPKSASQVREAIRLACCQWGGTYFPIVPTHRRLPATWREAHVRTPRAEDVVLGYLDAFDPDLIVQFGEELPSYLKSSRLKVVKPDDFWEDRGGAGQKSADPIYGIGVADLLYGIFKEHFKFAPKFPVKAVIPAIPRLHSLFWASLYGDYPSHVSDEIEREFKEALDITRPTASVGSFLELTAPNVLFPRRITQWETHLEGHARYGARATVFYMDATRVEDVIDYWNLRATGRPVLPFPKQFRNDVAFQEALSQFVSDHRRVAPHSLDVHDVVSFVRSRNCTFDEMEAFASTLDSDQNEKLALIAPRISLQHWYPRLWDNWARNSDGRVQDAYGTEQAAYEIDEGEEPRVRVKPILPKFAPGNTFRSVSVCANEIDFRLYGADRLLAEVFPKVEGDHLSHAMSGATFGEWRSGRHGLVRLVGNDFVENWRAMESETILFAWLRDKGWDAVLSPPGILAKQVYKRLGGWTQMLANKNVLSLIEHMNGGNVDKTGILKNPRVAKQRDIAVEHMKSEINRGAPNSRRFERLVEQGVFKLGLRSQCPTCQRTSWFGMSSLSEVLECPQCLQEFPAAGNVDQGKSGWSYRTAGPFSVASYADGAFSVLLALDAIGGRMSSTRRTTSVPSFEATNPSGKKLEADFAMFWRESIYGEDSTGLLFGESKSFNSFATKDVERMKYLGELFPGSILVFSTLRNKLEVDEIAAIARLAKTGRKVWKDNRPINPVLILTEAELLQGQRPPFCWSEELKKKFQHIHSLMDWCNASQQIYLDLPSWHEDWAKQMKMRRTGRTRRIE